VDGGVISQGARQAIAFLNDLGGEKARLFGVEIRTARIGESPPGAGAGWAASERW